LRRVAALPARPAGARAPLPHARGSPTASGTRDPTARLRRGPADRAGRLAAHAGLHEEHRVVRGETEEVSRGPRAPGGAASDRSGPAAVSDPAWSGGRAVPAQGSLPPSGRFGSEEGGGRGHVVAAEGIEVLIRGERRTRTVCSVFGRSGNDDAGFSQLDDEAVRGHGCDAEWA